MSSPYVNAGPAWGTAMEPSSDPVERNDSIDEWMAFHKGLPNEYSLRLALLKRELGKELVEYSLRRKEGLIPQREDLGWGFESSSRRNRARDINNRTQGLPFFEVKWKEGFTGRGVAPRDEHEHTEALVGPKNETIQDVMGQEPPTPPKTRDLWLAVDRGESDGVDRCYRESWDNDDGSAKVDALQGIANEAYQVLNASEHTTSGELHGCKRRRDSASSSNMDGSSGREDAPTSKRRRLGQTPESYSVGAHIGSLRPTFFGKAHQWNESTQEWEPTPDNPIDDNDCIVTSVRNADLGEYGAILGSSRRYVPKKRSWTADECETMRSWVQDYGINDFDHIAWCLKRKAYDCWEQYQKTVRWLNKRAGRNPEAGLGWKDPELQRSLEWLKGQKGEEQADGAEKEKENTEAGQCVPTIRVEPPAPKDADSPPPSSRLRPRKPKATTRLMDFGLIRYDPNARSFPKSFPPSIDSDLGEKPVKTEEPDDVNMEDLHEAGSDLEVQEERPAGSDREGRQTYSKTIGGRIVKRTRKGARRGIDRRAGRGRWSSSRKCIRMHRSGYYYVQDGVQI